MSDDEMIEKPKRQMSEKQKEALKKGRELAKLNREASKKPVEKPVEAEVKPETKKREKKVKTVEVKEVENVVVQAPSPTVQGKRVSRKPKEVREPSPEPLPVEVVKKTRTPRIAAAPVKPRTKKEGSETLVSEPKPIRQKASLQFV